jgi:putative ABC transport system substrate-binding protein
MISRRRLVFALSLCPLAAPFAALAQQSEKVRRVGFLYFGSRRSAMESGRHDAFLGGMRDLGYAEGRDYVVESRFADGVAERLPSLVAELMRWNPEIIVATGTPVYAQLKRSASLTPVVITVTADPVLDGFAASLARPGGKFTGLSTGNVELYPKQIELMKAAVPKLSHVAVLWTGDNPGHVARLEAMLAVARKAGLRALAVEAQSPDAIERGFSRISRERAQAVVILNDTFFVQQFGQIAALALKHRLPSLYGAVEYAKAGGFMGYGQNVVDNFRRAATFVDKILKGAKPGELPFEQPMRLQLAINRRTAKAIGLALPRELLLRADKVIE